MDVIKSGFEVSNPLRFLGRRVDPISGMLTKARYYAHLLRKSREKQEWGYMEYIYKMNMLLVMTRFPVLKNILPTREKEFTELALTMSDCRERVKIILEGYVAFRQDDDVVDGDTKRVFSPTERIEYIAQRIDALENDNWSRHRAPDKLMKKAIKYAHKLGIDEEIREYWILILESLKYDAQRIADFQQTGERKFYAGSDITHNYFQLDAEGTAGAMMVVLGEDKYQIDWGTLRKSVLLTIAVRISYTLRDFKEDVEAGLINISREDALEFGITMEEIETFGLSDDPYSQAPESIKNWMHAQIEEAREYLAQTECILDDADGFKDFTRLVLKNQYFNPCVQLLDEIEENLETQESTDSMTRIRFTQSALAASRKLALESVETLNIFPLEMEKYLSKCRNLTLMYIGFSSERTEAEAVGAGRSAFLSVAYDVCTDWREPGEYLGVFETLAQEYSHNQFTPAAIDMMHRDTAGQLTHDGLERGSVSLAFILEEMGIYEEYRRAGCDIEETGRLLQVVDDIIDLEEDIAEDELNCLRSNNRDMWLRFFIEKMEDGSLLAQFPGKVSLLKFIIGKQKKKAQKLLEES